jgi:hypothetical protein
MSQHKVEISLQGEFTTIDVFLEGKEIPLKEINDNDYYKVYTAFEIFDPLDISVRLKGFMNMKWKITIKVNDSTLFTKSGVFDSKGFVTFKATKTI